MPVSEPLLHATWVLRVHFSNDGRRLVTAGMDEDPAAQIWEVPQPTLPVPDWLPDLVEGIVGGRMTPHGFSESGPVASADTLRQRAEATSSGDFYRKWAVWFFDLRGSGPRRPFRPE